MVRFENDGRLVIELHAGISAVDSVDMWQELHDGLCTALINMLGREEVLPSNAYVLAQLLSELLPDWERAKRLAE